MRDEDRKPSKRVFPLLQNLDLDSVTFAQLQSTGDPITLEDMNVQELEDLLLCQFARLAVKSEWTGLLEAGGGEFNAVLTDYNWDGDTDPIRIMCLPPYGTQERNHTTSGGNNDNLVWHPFISPFTGTISEVDFYVGGSSGGTGAVDMGFYSDNDGLPQTFLGEFVLATTSTGTITQTTSSEDVDLVKGTQYWVGLFFDNLASGATFTVTERTASGSGLPCVGANGVGAPEAAIYELDASGTGNHTITDYTALRPIAADPPNIGVKF
jgi:hypothetical protein